MPNVWAHFIFGQQVMERLGESSLITSDQRKRLFNLGCQGPDFLFYHRFLPWQNSKALNLLGTEMHNRHCGPVIMSLLDSVQGSDMRPDEPNDAVVYLLGFVLHHILDRHVHPYVFSKSGFRKWDHQRFEIMMDTAITAKLWEIDTTTTPVWRYIRTNNGLPRRIVAAFEAATSQFYPVLAPDISKGQWNEAIRDFTAAQRLFHDPTGIRRKLTFGQIEPFVFKPVPEHIDVLNVEETPWLDPVTGNTYRSESVWTLWNRALDDACRVIPAILAWFRACPASETIVSDASEELTNELRSKAASWIGNRSYETGLDCDTGLRIQYADTIWDDQPGITRLSRDN